jgi:hypothetical protein
MKFYVASSVENMEAAKLMMESLKEKGHKITFDWTTYEIPKDLPENIKDALKRDLSDRAVSGVMTADVLVLLLPGRRGAYTELGMALGSQHQVVIVVGSEDKSSSFIHSSRVNHRFTQVSQFYLFIDEWSKRNGHI